MEANDAIYHQKCALCLRWFEYCKTESVEEEENDNNINICELHGVCDEYLQSDPELADILNWNDLWQSENPLCNQCRDNSEKLLSVNTILKETQEDIKRLVTSFRKQIHKHLREQTEGNQIREGFISVLKEESDAGQSGTYDGNNLVSLDFMEDGDYDESQNEYSVEDVDPLGDNEAGQISNTEFSGTYLENDNKYPQGDSSAMLSSTQLRGCKKLKIPTIPTQSCVIILDRLVPSSTNARVVGDFEDLAERFQPTEHIKLRGRNISKTFENSCMKNTRGKGKKKKTVKVKNATKKENQTCKVCDRVFPSGKSFNGHSKIHLQQSWQCEICEKTFYNVTMQKAKHMSIYHPETVKTEIEIKCKLCSETFTSQFEFEVHTLEHKGEIPFTCPKCKKSLSNMQSYTDHLRHTSCASTGLPSSMNEVFPCGICKQPFQAKYLLWLHELDHTNPDRSAFDCKVCGKRLRKKPLIEKHFIFHTNEKPFICDICLRPMSYAYSLHLHRQTHKAAEHCETKCTICNLTFSNGQSMYHHKRTHHPETSNRPSAQCKIGGPQIAKGKFSRRNTKVQERESEGLKCELCNKIFATSFALCKHAALLHKIGPLPKLPRIKNTTKTRSPEGSPKILKRNRSKNKVVESEVKTESRREIKNNAMKRYNNTNVERCCDKCGLVFSSRLKYYNHLRNHKYTGVSIYGTEPPFECVNCKAQFSERDLIKLHYSTNSECNTVFQKIQLKKRKFKCDVCDYRALTTPLLILHARSHTGEKPFQCENCGLRFTRKSKLITHINKLGGNCDTSAYACKHCANKCKSISELKEHYNLNPECKTQLDATKRYPCEVCGKRIESYKRLQVHMKVHNGQLGNDEC